VLHRDLKPSNVLLGPDGGPRITDFGIARQISANTEELTQTGQLLGSPGYTAPEQALQGQADPRTDVYGLGALLYHLLTGHPPFQGPTLGAILLQVREAEPAPPRLSNPTVPRDLETICLECLHKDPARRYPTARAVAEDLERFLAGKPTRARPPGLPGRAARWCRRRPGVATLMALCAAMLVSLVVGSLSFARKQSQLEHRAQLIAEARTQRNEGLAGHRENALKNLRTAWRIQPSAELRSEAAACLALTDLQPARRLAPEHPLTRPPEPGGSADGRVGLRFADGKLSIVRSADGRELASFNGFTTRPLAQLDDSGSRVAIAFRVESRRADEVAIFDVSEDRTPRRLLTLEHPHPIRCLDWAGELLAVGGSSDRLIHIWETTTGRRLHRFNGHDAELEAVRFRPGGQELVSCAQDSIIRIWHAGRGTELVRLERQREHVGPAWWSPDGTELILPLPGGAGVEAFRISWPNSIQVLAPGTDEPRPENLRSLDLNPRGDLVAVVDETGCRVWSLPLGRQVGFVPRTDNEWMTAAFSDSESLWIAGWNRPLRRIPVRTRDSQWPYLAPREATGADSGPLLVAVRADGGALALTNNRERPDEDSALIYFPGTKHTLRLTQEDPYCAALSPDGRWAVTGSFSQRDARLWRLPDGKLERILPHPGVVLGATFTDGGNSLWLWGDTGVQHLETRSWNRASEFNPRLLTALTFSGNGNLAASTLRETVILHRLPDFAELLRLPVPSWAGRVGSATLALSHDGRQLALHTANGSVVVWNLASLHTELQALEMEW
jgi:WD40 repeat protein